MKNVLKQEPKDGATDLTVSSNSNRGSVTSIDSLPSTPDGKSIMKHLINEYLYYHVMFQSFLINYQILNNPNFILQVLLEH